jgi:hypothetical protein
MIELACKCGQKIVTFKHLKEGQIVEFEAECCLESQSGKVEESIEASKKEEIKVSVKRGRKKKAE